MNSSNDTKDFSWWDLIRSFYYLLDTRRKSYLFNTIILLIALSYDLIPVVIVGRIVDFFTTYTPGTSLTPFYSYVGFLTVTLIIALLVRLSMKKKLANIQSETVYFTRVKGFEKLLDFSVKWHDKENTGNKVQRIQAGTTVMGKIQQMLSKEVFRYIISLIGVSIAFMFMGFTFFLFAFVYIAIFALIQISFYRKTVELNNENNALLEKAGGTYYEGLSNILTIKTLGVKNDFKTGVESREVIVKENTLKRINLGNNKWKVFQLVNAFALGGIILFAGQSFVAGTISLGSILIVYNYFQRLNDAVTHSGETFDELISIRSAIGRMMPIFWGDTGAREGKEEFPKEWSEIEIKNSSFKYVINGENENEEMGSKGISNLDLKIKRYEKVGVVGKSGSGKSTLAKIFLGLYPFDSGSFQIGETDFYDIKHDKLTREVALVLQDSEMFNMSLKENITLMRNFDATLFEKAISIAQLQDVIEKLPEGVNTLIGEKGYRLSGGERQRIGIARAIYKDPQILVLDEATSSLDSKTESLIQHALEKELTKKTVISIAHRVSTLKNVDRVVVFDEGKVVEEGTFKELSKNKDSLFYRISNTSSL